jgi:hypothetical protein
LNFIYQISVELNDDIKTGKETMNYPNGDHYIGDFLNDYFHGFGTFIYFFIF